MSRPKNKHDDDCLRRKVEMNMPYVCTCGLTDEQVREAHERFRRV